MQDSLNPGDRAFLRGQDTPYVCRVARANHQLSLLRVTRCSARRICEHCAAQEMEVWNLPEPHLSSLLSPLPPDRTAPFSAPLPPKGLGLEHAWELSGGGTTQSRCGLGTLEGPLRATEASGLGRHPTITSQSPRGVQPPSLSPSSPEALSSGRRSQRQGDQFLWEVPPNTPCLPCL